jgi:membrane protein implicated in regulation of membrane protease activity
MDDWVLWLIAAVVLSGVEIATTTLFVAPFAAGALLAMVAALLGGGIIVSGIVFLVSSALLFGFVRPIARRHLHTPPSIRTGTAALVGRTATVVEPVGAGQGCVKIDGEVWSARLYDEDGDAVLEPGRRVHVLEIRGATALVSD